MAWKFLANLGDVNPLDYGGTFAYMRDDDVVLLHFEPFPVDEYQNLVRGGTTEVYMILCERCTLTDGVLSDNPFHPLHPVWFAKDVDSICESCDIELDDFLEYICGDDLYLRARAYETLLWYYGPFEFDQYPMTHTRSSLRRLWRRIFTS